jgi:hypothetical protein
MRKEDDPSLSLLTSPGPAAAKPGAYPKAGQVTASRGGLDARYEQLRHAALHARAGAFPLGLGVLTGKGITAWRHALASAAPAAMPARPATFPPPPAGPQAAAMPALPARLAAELIHALAGLALTGP